jgi:hypothetical protein
MVALAIYGLLRALVRWPADRYQGWVLLVIVLLSSLPISLLILQALISLGGTVKIPGGIEVSFAAVSTTAASLVRSTTLSENLDISYSPTVQSEGMRSILRALRDASRNDVTVVNLRSGETWWESRLFILMAGATKRAQPKAVAFVGDRNGRRGMFLGWAQPRELLAAHMSAAEELRRAEKVAAAEAAKWDLGTPEPGLSPRVRLPWEETILYLPSLSGDEEPDTRFAYELFLQRELELSQNEGGRFQRPVTLSRLRELYEPILVVDQIEATADDDEWTKLLSSSSRPYFALTSAGVFRSLVPRDALVSTLIAALTSRLERA